MDKKAHHYREIHQHLEAFKKQISTLEQGGVWGYPPGKFIEFYQSLMTNMSSSCLELYGVLYAEEMERRIESRKA